MTFLRAISTATVTVLMMLYLSPKVFASEQNTEQVCHWIGGGNYHAIFAQAGQRITYNLSSTNKTWRNAPYSRHGPGLLECEDCINGLPAGGPYNFMGYHPIWIGNRTIFAVPDTAKQRIKLVHENLWYPLVNMHGWKLQALSRQEKIQFGKYFGYAILFKAIPKNKFERPPKKLRYRDLHIFILSLSDGCMRFELTLKMSKSPISIHMPVDSLLSDISISNTTRNLNEAEEELVKRLLKRQRLLSKKERVKKRQEQQHRMGNPDANLIELMPKDN